MSWPAAGGGGGGAASESVTYVQSFGSVAVANNADRTIATGLANRQGTLIEASLGIVAGSYTGDLTFFEDSGFTTVMTPVCSASRPTPWTGPGISNGISHYFRVALRIATDSSGNLYLRARNSSGYQADTLTATLKVVWDPE